MAARRLLIVLVVLLAISTFTALLVPPQGTDEGEVVEASIDVDRAKVRSVQLELGDQLALEVRSRSFHQVVIGGFGLIDDVARDAPARFNLFADRTGRFAVRLLDRRETVGRIVIAARSPRRARG
jgi:hypothetical protein